MHRLEFRGIPERFRSKLHFKTPAKFVRLHMDDSAGEPGWPAVEFHFRAFDYGGLGFEDCAGAPYLFEVDDALGSRAAAVVREGDKMRAEKTLRSHSERETACFPATIVADSSLFLFEKLYTVTR